MFSRINKRKKKKTGLQVWLGVGDLHLGQDLCQGRVGFAEARQKLAILDLWVRLGVTPSPRQSSLSRRSFLRLGGELLDCTKMTFFPLFHRKFPTKTKPYQNKSQNPTQNSQKYNMEELGFPNPNIDNEGVRRVS